MKNSKKFLAFDLGGSSGRAVLGELDRGVLKLREVHRFLNQPGRINGVLQWNFLSLWMEILEGLRKCSHDGMCRLDGIAIDAWGVGFGLFGKDGTLLGNPIHYRDATADGATRALARRMTEEEVYRITGIPFTPPLKWMYAMRHGPSKPILDAADRYLMISDAFRYLLSGHAACERTAASCSQLLDIRTGQWSSSIFNTFNFPRRIMPSVILPGTVVGTVLKDIQAQTGIESAPVIAVAGHDTPSAVAAVPVVDPETVFLSTGTWSVLGVPLQQPMTSPETLKRGFVNEFGFESVLFVKNGMGLYLLENLRRVWNRQDRKTNHATMVKAAANAKPFQFYFDINSPLLFAAEDQAEKQTAAFLRASGQRGTPSRGELIRSLLEALAFSYRQGLADLQFLTGKSYQRISLVGGGVHNALYCQFVADATGLGVIAGPAEASVIGNLAIQAVAVGALRKSTDVPELVSRSFPLKTYRPRQTERWDEHFERYQEIQKRARQG